MKFNYLNVLGLKNVTDWLLPLFLKILWVFTPVLAYSQSYSDQVLCANYLKRMGANFILQEEREHSRLPGQCDLEYQASDRNKCHSWAAAIFNRYVNALPSVFTVNPRCHASRICIHNMFVNNPGNHQFVMVTVTSGGHNPHAFIVDGWMCEFFTDPDAVQRRVIDLYTLGDHLYELPTYQTCPTPPYMMFFFPTFNPYCPREWAEKRHTGKIFNFRNAPKIQNTQCIPGVMYM